MKSHLVLLGIFLVFTVVGLVSGSDDFESLDFESSEESEEHVGHGDHHNHHQFVPNPFEGKSAPEAVVASPPVITNSNAPKLESQKAVPLGMGTNVSGFNETCNSSRICNTVKELQCVETNSTCQCNKNFVYAANTEGCLRIMGTQDARGIMLNDCTQDVQCQYGKWGTYSRCEKASRRCQCNADAIFIDDTCMLNRTVGDLCVSHKQCNLTIVGEAVCKLIEGSSANTYACDCAIGHIWDNHHKECLKVAIPEKAINSTCKSDRQCQASSLGNLSRCDHDDLQCRCHDPVKPGNENVIVYKNICYTRKYINDTCTSTLECEAGITNSVCEEAPSYTVEKICKCPNGKKCETRKNSAMGIFASDISRSTLLCIAVATLVFGRISTGHP